MKYVISDKDEVSVGSFCLHEELARSFKGNVVRAGHCEKKDDGTYRVYGESIGYNIKAMPEDAEILKSLLTTNKDL